MHYRNPTDPDHDTLTVTLPDLVKYLGVSKDMVMKYAREGGMPKGEAKGRYPLRDCVLWKIRKLENKTGEDSHDIAEERRKLIMAQRVGQELNNSKTRGELLDADLVASTMQQMAALFTTQLDGLAARVAPQLSQMRDPGEIAKVIFDECRAVRRSASGAVASFAGELAGGEDPEPAPEAKRGRVGRRKPDLAPGLPGAGAVAD